MVLIFSKRRMCLTFKIGLFFKRKYGLEAHGHLFAWQLLFAERS